MIKTKIVCTMGPAVANRKKIFDLIQAGMNVARLNFSHGTHAEHLNSINLLKTARKESDVPLAIMLDTKGPEIRVGTLPTEGLPLEQGSQLTLIGNEYPPEEGTIPIHPSSVLSTLDPGTSILFDDGYIEATVIENLPHRVRIEFKNGGILKSNKGVNVPDVDTKLPAMTEKDISDIRFGVEQGIDIIAASFIRSAEHVLEIKRLLVDLNASHILVLAKIESRLGIQNFLEILQVSDGIMVARGDLGVELPLEQVPILQKMMIRECNEACKPVITATQMLESMTKNPRPTRAEASDVANAILDGTSAVMLSGETAAGYYPIESVTMMRRIIEETEKDYDYKNFFEEKTKGPSLHVSLSVALASVLTAYSADAKAIFALTNSGLTARLISHFHPSMPIIAQTCTETIYHQLALYWGVFPAPPAHFNEVKKAVCACSRFAMDRNILRFGDLVVVTAGTPFGESGTTNTMTIENIGDVLVRGSIGHGKTVIGKAYIIPQSAENNISFPKESIVVINRCNESMEDVLKKARGIILQNHPQDVHSEKCAQDIATKFDIPLILRAAGALHQLHNSMSITLDPSKGLIFKGPITQEKQNSSSTDLKDLLLKLKSISTTTNSS